jgi:uncharacterized protein YeaC (DUF1315 family)
MCEWNIVNLQLSPQANDNGNSRNICSKSESLQTVVLNSDKKNQEKQENTINVNKITTITLEQRFHTCIHFALYMCAADQAA